MLVKPSCLYIIRPYHPISISILDKIIQNTINNGTLENSSTARPPKHITIASITNSSTIHTTQVKKGGKKKDSEAGNTIRERTMST
jgi:hypothetical protein